MSHPVDGVTHVNVTISTEDWSKIDDINDDVPLSFKSFNGQFERGGDFPVDGIIPLLSI